MVCVSLDARIGSRPLFDVLWARLMPNKKACKNRLLLRNELANRGLQDVLCSGTKLYPG